MRDTASLRDDTPSFRYREITSDLTVWREMWSRSPISGMERCVGSSGTSLSSAAVRDDAPIAVRWIWLILACSSSTVFVSSAEVGTLLQDARRLTQRGHRAALLDET